LLHQYSFSTPALQSGLEANRVCLAGLQKLELEIYSVGRRTFHVYNAVCSLLGGLNSSCGG
ncbi:hypothetical protein chiPu_0022307, partial [Chiloscyllium punctatum]|nr:hypothetical protein [Chiloscyllium punctatum]